MTDKPHPPEAGQSATEAATALGATQDEPGDVPLPTDLGAFIHNIRGPAEDDLSELRDSLRGYGWVAQFPALRDESGMVLVGHRRLAVAAELGIAPVYQDITLGEGNVADAERLKIALVSNIGFAALSPKRRQRIAARLRELGWTQQKIGDALRVSQKQVSLDLDETLKATSNVREQKKNGAQYDTLGRKRSTGRPRKAKPETAEPRIDRAAKALDACSFDDALAVVAQWHKNLTPEKQRAVWDTLYPPIRRPRS